MDRYIGIDVHQESCTVAVMGPSGRRLQHHRVETNGSTLVGFIKGVSGDKHVCFEEGTQSAWIYELLEPVCSDVTVVQMDKRKGVKSDAADAWELADLLRRGGKCRRIFKAKGQYTALRQAVATHRMAVQDMVRSKNRLKALYRSRGVRTNATIYDPEQRGSWLKKLPPAQRRGAVLQCAQLDGVTETARQAEDWLLEEARRCAAVQLVATAPGIGQIRGAQIVATVVAPHRFRTKRQLWSYCGLAVVTEVTGEWTQSNQGRWERRRQPQPRGLNRNRHPLLKEVFKGAALTVVTLMPEHPLGQKYTQALVGGMKPDLARLTLARRISAAVLAMWKSKQPYDEKRHAM